MVARKTNRNHGKCFQLVMRMVQNTNPNSQFPIPDPLTWKIQIPSSKSQEDRGTLPRIHGILLDLGFGFSLGFGSWKLGFNHISGSCVFRSGVPASNSP